jgi:hypothetical protein
MSINIEMPRVTFVSRINRMATKEPYKIHKKTITIPSDFWNDVEELEKRKQIKVTIEEAYD